VGERHSGVRQDSQSGRQVLQAANTEQRCARHSLAVQSLCAVLAWVGTATLCRAGPRGDRVTECRGLSGSGCSACLPACLPACLTWPAATSCPVEVSATGAQGKARSGSMSGMLSAQITLHTQTQGGGRGKRRRR
jgi:hypothetical protein